MQPRLAAHLAVTELQKINYAAPQGAAQKFK